MKLKHLKTLFFLCVFLSSSIVQAQATRSATDYFFHQSFGDLTEELTTAKDEEKFGIMVMFETTECPWCEKMKQRVLNQVDIQDYFRKHFQIITVDTEGDVPIVNFEGVEMPERDFAFVHNRVRATPVFLFFDIEGKPVARYTGATRNAKEFRMLGEYVVEGHYATQNFTKYKRARLSGAES